MLCFFFWHLSNQKSLRADESSASSSMTMGGMINNMKPQALQASQISNTMSSRGNNIIAGSHSGLEPLTDSTKNAENDEAEFIDKLSSGQVKTRRPTGFNLRRGASAQAIVEDPQHKEVYCKRRTTIYASTEMGLKQEYKAPFSTDVCGTFSCHGIAPAEEEEPDDMLRMVIGNTSVDKAKVYQKVNQDRGCVVYPFNSNPNEALFLVLDGHGDQGDRVSEFVMTEVEMNALDHMMKVIFIGIYMLFYIDLRLSVYSKRILKLCKKSPWLLLLMLSLRQKRV